MSSDWRERPEGGSIVALKIIVWIALNLGRTATRLMLLPVALYFFVFRGKERTASREFLGRISDAPVPIGKVFRHFLTFSRVVADRIFFLTDYHERIPITTSGVETLRPLVAKKKGGIVLAAHFGSFEAARVLGKELGEVTVRVVLNRGVNSQLIRQLEELNSDLADAIIESEQSSATLGLKIAEALEKGEWIGFLADRYQPGDRTTSCDFLGGKANFPVGPFIIAAVFKVPLICIFPVYVKGGYEVYCETMSDEFTLPREGRDKHLHEHVQAYVDRLSVYVRKAPYNWFNFYDFWKSTSK
jgi:predicted LPLAT superfamily acyltransferase